MKRLILVFVILLLLPLFVSAHPGRTASEKGKATVHVKAPGWEYELKIEKQVLTGLSIKV